MSEEKSPALKIIIAVGIIVVVGIFIANSGGKVERANSEGDNNSTNNNEPIPPQKPAKPKELAFIKEGLVFHCDFNGNAEDKSGNDNNGTVNGATFTTDRHGEPDKAANFDGNNDFITFDVPSLDQRQHKMSIAFWLRVESIPENKYAVHVVSKGQTDILNSYTIVFYLFGGLQTGERRGYMVPLASFGGEWGGSHDEYLPDMNSWHHYMVSFDGSTLQYFVDGEVLSSDKKKGPLPGNNNLLRIGGGWYGAWLDGQIDELRIYNRALSAKEVKALYDLEKPKGK